MYQPVYRIFSPPLFPVNANVKRSTQILLFTLQQISDMRKIVSFQRLLYAFKQSKITLIVMFFFYLFIYFSQQIVIEIVPNYLKYRLYCIKP